MRSLLQCFGFASSTLFATLLLGIVLVTPARAGPDPLPGEGCTDQCGCNSTQTACQRTGTTTTQINCASACNCNPNGGNPICNAI